MGKSWNNGIELFFSVYKLNGFVTFFEPGVMKCCYLALEKQPEF